MVAWNHHHHLRNKSFWEIDAKANDPWGWKYLLKLRSLAQRFIYGSVDNGNTVSFWFDNWKPFRPLIEFLGQQGPRDLRFPLSSKVADDCGQTGWNFPSPISDQALALQIFLSTMHSPTDSLLEDEYNWQVNGTSYPTFVSNKTWERPRKNVTGW